MALVTGRVWRSAGDVARRAFLELHRTCLGMFCCIERSCWRRAQISLAQIILEKVGCIFIHMDELLRVGMVGAKLAVSQRMLSKCTPLCVPVTIAARTAAALRGALLQLVCLGLRQVL